MSHVLLEYIEDKSLEIRQLNEIENIDVNSECIVSWAPSGSKRKPTKHAAKILRYGGEFEFASFK